MLKSSLRVFWPSSNGPRLPPSVRWLIRTEWSVLLLYFVSHFLSGTPPGQNLLKAIPPWIVIAFDACVFGALILGLFLALWLADRFQSRLASASYRLCVRCHYDLVGLEPIGRCPECGTPYEIDRVPAMWHEWIGQKPR